MNQTGPDYRTALFVVALLIGTAALLVYWRVGREDTAGDYQVKKGNYRLEDGQYEEAVLEFQTALERNPEHLEARLGLALTYMQMGRSEEALQAFSEILERDPEYAAAYANRGILLDRLGRSEEALADYREALELNPDLAKGPGWLWRFLRNIQEKPPTIRDRAAYLEAELAKPPEERLLRVPEEDQKQRMYKVK